VLDFRFLIGTILVGIALAMTALRMFGPVEPLLADRPDLDMTVVRTFAPGATAPSPGPEKTSPPLAAVPIIPKPPKSIQNTPVPVPVQTPQIASTPRAPMPAILAPPPPTAFPAAYERAAVPLPSPKPAYPDITGSIEPGGADVDPAPARPKRAPVAVRKPETPEFGELNLFRLFFPQAAGQKPPQGAARPPAFPRPFTQ
jgi:hypothetical protein